MFCGTIAMYGLRWAIPLSRGRSVHAAWIVTIESCNSLSLLARPAIPPQKFLKPVNRKEAQSACVATDTLQRRSWWERNVK